MFRTRSLAILTFILIGAVAGGLLAFFQYHSVRAPLAAGVIMSDDGGIETFSATIPSVDEAAERETRLAVLQKKLKNRDIDIVVPSQPEPVVTTIEEAADTLLGEDRCTDFSVFGGTWDSRGLTVADREGVREVYKETLIGTSTVPTKTVVLELPLRSKPVAQNCITSDVVAISINGALIRNADARAYIGTPSDRLIGYTLDGFPLYGGLSVPADACGGAMVAGQYRYGLSSDRDVILHCFAAKPITL